MSPFPGLDVLLGPLAHLAVLVAIRAVGERLVAVAGFVADAIDRRAVAVRVVIVRFVVQRRVGVPVRADDLAGEIVRVVDRPVRRGLLQQLPGGVEGPRVRGQRGGALPVVQGGQPAELVVREAARDDQLRGVRGGVSRDLLLPAGLIIIEREVLARQRVAAGERLIRLPSPFLPPDEHISRVHPNRSFIETSRRQLRSCIPVFRRQCFLAKPRSA